MSKNLVTRIIVAAIAIPVILWISYQGGTWLAGMVLLLALLAISEFLVNEGYRASSCLFWFGLAIAGLMVARFHIFGYSLWYMFVFGGPVFVLIIMLFVGMAFATGRRPPDELFRGYVRFVWGVLYIGLLYPYVYLVGADHIGVAVAASGGDWLLFLFGLLWVGDTAAMGFGKWLGRRKLAPAVSPNKTVAGFVGGIAGALAIGVVMYFWKFRDLEWYHVLILAALCSVFGQLGDLVESMWKRSLNIKDSSSIIPGHGGVLDRFDSLLFAAPAMFFYRLIFLT
ncbi:MAG: phosphatidate cytidylyltransferase [Candidatus Zixiibacteriota bacterium]|nr:MAG: phosphatidate cytidylyltransferase [candidate division Zixibacteria bacterium]